MNKSHLGAACLTVGFAITGLAQNATPQSDSSSSKPVAPGQFTVVDTNRDGRISPDEARAYSNLGASFATLDIDKDSYLSRTEFGKWNAGPNNSGASKESLQSSGPSSSSSPSADNPHDAGNDNSSSPASDGAQ